MDALNALLTQQHGLASRGQLRAAGISARALQSRLDREWRLVLPQVVCAAGFAPVTPQQRLIAALLEAGEHAVITGHHACLAHGFSNADATSPVQVLVPRVQASRAVGFVKIQRTARLPRALERRGVRVVPRQRAVIDAARSATTLNGARAIVLEAVQRRLVPLERLERELDAGPRRGRRLTRLALADAAFGAWSVPEAELLRLCSTSAVLPPALMNPQLRVGGRRLLTPDLWFDDVGMAVMVHSRAHHLREADWEGTVEGDNELTAHGIVVVGITPASIRRSPQKVLATLERAYASARTGRCRPDVTVTPRGR